MAQIQSSTARFLKGKLVPFSRSPVREVLKAGGQRIIIFENGMRHTLTKREHTTVLGRVMAQEQARAMLKTIRPTSEGKVAVKIGGNLKGTERQYASRQNAIKGLERAYGLKAPNNTSASSPAVASRFNRIGGSSRR